MQPEAGCWVPKPHDEKPWLPMGRTVDDPKDAALAVHWHGCLEVEGGNMMAVSEPGQHRSQTADVVAIA